MESEGFAGASIKTNRAKLDYEVQALSKDRFTEIFTVINKIYGGTHYSTELKKRLPDCTLGIFAKDSSGKLTAMGTTLSLNIPGNCTQDDGIN